MPDASPGGEGGRVNTPAPRVPPGHVRIDLESTGEVTFTQANGRVTDMVTEVTSQYTMGERTLTYTCRSGYAWTAPADWRSGDTIPAAEITWTATPVRAYEDYARRDEFLYGGRAAPYVGIRCRCVQCSGNEYELLGFAPRYESEVPQDRLRRQQQRRELEDLTASFAQIEARAEETLQLVLRPDELKQYKKKTKQIIVTGADKRRYLIQPGIVGNVYLLDKNDQTVASLCCHPDMRPHGDGESLPYKDAHIAQILYLRHDLDKFWETANVNWYDETARDEYLDGLPASRRRSLTRKFRRAAW